MNCSYKSKVHATTAKLFGFNGLARNKLPAEGCIRRWRTTPNRAVVSTDCFVATSAVVSQRRDRVQKTRRGYRRA
jgi:hypothetical protein